MTNVLCGTDTVRVAQRPEYSARDADKVEARAKFVRVNWMLVRLRGEVNQLNSLNKPRFLRNADRTAWERSLAVAAKPFPALPPLNHHLSPVVDL
ncbi:hypothetical protein Pan189_40000 [Stratiformator vulcanicus]|uniref:Uncharacterized protein n=1 Tax=Stratiformator vulcanicus TaxID=2527980 RepID=A0A517R6Y0_9PLAN|nr:hypothetical protein Pan189_40000 [Stratiformator vulcanicus]